MNYYSFNLGDYASATRHLSWDEDMAYRRLLDAYYQREGPLPASKTEVYRLAGCRSRPHKAAVDAVLSEFFEITPDGYRHPRCDEEIAIAAEKAAERAARKENETDRQRKYRGRRRILFERLRDLGVVPHYDTATVTLEEMLLSRERNGPVTRDNTTPVTRDATALHSQSQSQSQKLGEVSCARASSDLETRLREAAGWQSHPAPNLFVTGPIDAMIASGADLEADILPTIRATASRCDGPNWKFFIPAIRRAMATRLEASKPLTPEEISNARKGKKFNRAAGFAIVDALVDAAERREIQASESGNGPPAGELAGKQSGGAGISGGSDGLPGPPGRRGNRGPDPSGNGAGNEAEISADAGRRGGISGADASPQGPAGGKVKSGPGD